MGLKTFQMQEEYYRRPRVEKVPSIKMHADDFLKIGLVEVVMKQNGEKSLKGKSGTGYRCP